MRFRHQEGAAVIELPSDPTPGLWSAVVADATELRALGAARRAFGSPLEALLWIAGRCLASPPFLALALYRLRVRLSARGHRRLAGLLARVCAVVGGVRIDPDARLEGGVVLPDGRVSIAGPAEVAATAIIERAVEIGPDESGRGAPSIGRGARIEAGSRLVGEIRVGAGARVMRWATVRDDVAPFVTVAGSPARPTAAHAPRRMRDLVVTPEPERDPPHPMADYFEGVRLQRQARYAAYGPARRGKRRLALLTMTRDEASYFPIWLRYYSRFFEPADIHVLDHETTDGSLDGEGFVRVPVSHEGHSTTWMGKVIEDYHRQLFDHYDVVLKVDVDEIVAPHPELGDLGQYLDRFDEDWVNALGYELLHVRGIEPPLDPSRPVLAQRRYWYANDGYDKPVLASQPLEWALGFHRRADGQMALDPDLRLIHLHRMDFDICRQRHQLRARWQWDPADLRSGRGVHNRIAEGPDFERWFYEDASAEGVEIVVERIPSAWKNLV